MDDEDKNDIIKKVNTSGGNGGENSSEDNNDMGDSGNNDENGSDNGFGGDDIEDNFGDEEGGFDDELKEGKMKNLMSEPKKCNMFQPGNPGNLEEGKISRNYLSQKLKETFNRGEEKEEEVKKEIPVNRSNMPFVGKTKQDIEEDKTKNNYQVYHPEFMDALQEIINYVHSRGLTLDRQEWDAAVGNEEDIMDLNDGEVKTYKIPLYKDGEKLKEMCQVQIEKTGNKYELNMYFN